METYMSTLNGYLGWPFSHDGRSRMMNENTLFQLGCPDLPRTLKAKGCGALKVDGIFLLRLRLRMAKND